MSMRRLLTKVRSAQPMVNGLFGLMGRAIPPKLMAIYGVILVVSGSILYASVGSAALYTFIFGAGQALAGLCLLIISLVRIKPWQRKRCLGSSSSSVISHPVTYSPAQRPSTAARLELVNQLMDNQQLHLDMRRAFMDSLVYGTGLVPVNLPGAPMADNVWTAYNARNDRQGGRATAKQRACGLAYPQGRGFDFGHDIHGHGGDGHQWKFMWHTPDGEPQVIKCVRCKYVLWRSQCHGKWLEQPQFNVQQVDRKYGGWMGKNQVRIDDDEEEEEYGDLE